MQFTEIGFAVFLLIVFCLYWFALRKTIWLRNLMVLSASYIFYGWWDWRFLILIVITTLSTFGSALFIPRRHGKVFLVANIVLNLGILAVFKYLGFFTENLQRLFSLFGWNLDWFTIDVLLPVGISFYTFQAIAYSIDVYRKNVKPERNIITFATFIAYFPQLVAGPIERAAQLLPQLRTARPWERDYAVSGLRMILFGVLKKVAVADILAVYVDEIFNEGNLANPLIVLAAGLLFSLQIYCDFSAYSEIARGTSRLLGIELMANFRFPYFSRNIMEFWRRWHISLMMWFRDYLYIPMGGNRKGKARTYLNIAVVFLLSGLWHGAAWNFIVWGAYWALANIIGRAFMHLKVPGKAIGFGDLPKIVETFMVVAFGFYIFRCETWQQMAQGFMSLPLYYTALAFLWFVALIITCKPFRTLYSCISLRWALGVLAVAAIIGTGIWQWQLCLRYFFVLPALFVFVLEWHGRNGDYPFATLCANRYGRWILYWVSMLFVVLSEPLDMSFIYFQF